MNTKHCQNCNARMVKTNGDKRPTNWSCPNCGFTVTSHPPSKWRANTSVKLPAKFKAWLVSEFGSLQEGIMWLVKEAIEKENEHGRSDLL